MGLGCNLAGEVGRGDGEACVDEIGKLLEGALGLVGAGSDGDGLVVEAENGVDRAAH